MPQTPVSLTLPGNDQEHHISLNNIQYLGAGSYSCLLIVRSNGFSCTKPFGFDNDEYFLAKLKGVLADGSGEAEMTDLQSDNYLRIQGLDNNNLLISGLLMETEPLNQSLEFAFQSGCEKLVTFAREFTHMVQSNI